MSVRTPIFTTPSEIFPAAGAADAAPASRAAASAKEVSETRTRPLMCASLSPRSDAEEALQRLHAALELGPCDDVDDPAALEQEVAVGQRGDEPEVLLDEDHGVAALLQRPHRA